MSIQLKNNLFKVYKPNLSSKIRLFCFHHSGGAASSYFPWVKKLDKCIELVAIQLPGREDRFNESFLLRIEDVLSELDKAIDSFLDKPFIVFGHSLGALIAYEFSKFMIERYSKHPLSLVVSAALPPHLIEHRELHGNLSGKEFIQRLEKYGSINDYILNNADLLNIFLPIIKNDLKILDNYTFKKNEPLACNLIALAGEDDQSLNLEDIKSWKDYTSQKFQILTYPGNHFFIKNNEDEIISLLNRICDLGFHFERI